MHRGNRDPMTLASLLKIYPGEEKKVSLAFTQAFGAGIFKILLQIIPVALFLQQYPASMLPYIYIGMSILSISLGFLYSFFEKRLSFFALFLLLLLTMMVPLFLLNLSAAFSTSDKIIIFLLLVWAQLIEQLMDLEFWGLFNRLFTLQQGKRLFGTIGATYNLGSIAASFALPLLTPFISVINIFFSTSVLLFLFIIILWKLNLSFPREMAGELEEVEQKKKETPQSPNLSSFSNIKTPYILQLFTTTFLMSALWYPIDFSFSVVIQEHYFNNQEMTNFLSRFYAIVTSVELLFRLFIFPFIIHYFGVITSASLLAVGITPIALLTLIFYFIDTQSTIFFGLILLNKSLDNSFRPSIFEPARLLMYQVLTPPIRAWVHSTTEITIKSAAALFASIAILAIDFATNNSLSVILGATFILAIASLAVNFSIKTEYIQSLVESLKMEYFPTTSTIAWGKESLELIQEGLRSRNPGRMIYSLNILEEIDKDLFIEALPRALKHSSALVKQQVLTKLTNYHLNELYPQALKLSRDTSENLKVRTAALLAVATLANGSYDKDIKPVAIELHSKTLKLRTAAIIGILQYGEESSVEMALKEFYELLYSSSYKKRKEAAFIMGEIPLFENSELIEILLNDPKKEVIRATIVAIAKLPHPKYYPNLLKLLTDPHFKDTVLHGFLAVGSDLLNLLMDEFPTSTDQGKIQILYLISHMKVPNEVKTSLHMTLLAWAHTESDGVSFALWETLTKLGYHLHKKDVVSIQQLDIDIVKESARLTHLLRQCQRVPREKGLSFLYHSLRRQLLNSEQRIYLILSCYYSPDMLKKVMLGAKSHNIQHQEYAMELLQTLLTQKHSSMLLSSISAIHQKKSIHIAPLKGSALMTFLLGIALDQKGYLSPICRSTALYEFYKEQAACSEEILQKIEAEGDKLLMETCAWIRKKLEEDL